MHRMNRSVLATLLVGALVVGGCSSTDDAADDGPTSTRAESTTTAVPAPPELPALRAIRGDQPRIVDDQDRQVILRGANLNSLGDYHQGDPDAVPVVPVTDADWAEMAAHGFNVVRLLVSWSKLEPERGTFDEEYLATVADAIDAAAAHGIYSVVDMHQDAWGKYIASPAGETCPDGGDPAIGWDGAPEWATLTDGASTCTFGSRESSRAVINAWDSFYANRDGIMDELVRTWEFVVGGLGDRPSIAGYDLLNEPNVGSGETPATDQLGRFYDVAITAIRAAEEPLGVDRIVFFEFTVAGQPVPNDFTADDNIVFAPHHYGESIGAIPIEGLFDYLASLAAGYRTALWVGEYGFFEDTDAAGAKLERYAAKEDALITAGDAWWQWRQACGDPHSVGRPGGTSDPVQIHLQTNRCPGDVNGGVNPRWKCLWRPYPRATAGVVTSLTASCDGALDYRASTPTPGTIEVWSPGVADQQPTVTGEGISDIDIAAVDGGFVVSATATGDYHVVLSPS